MQWEPTREAALEAMERFVPHAAAYAQRRNFDLGPDDRSNVSLLSPYLRHRLITEEEVWRAVLEKHEFARVEKFLQEVVWRTYWKGWLERHPAVWDDWLRSVKQAAQVPGVEQARDGRTGIEPLDVWANELREHGYLHNHARMWFASIWVFTLKLPWQAGAAFFMEHLLDGDPASNTLGWRWVAGLQTRGKHYLATRENIRRFTDGRLDPGDSLVTSAEPIEADREYRLIEPYLPPLPGDDSPGRDDGLLLTTDDLAPETLLDTGSFSAVAGGVTEPIRPLVESAAVAAFRRDAVLGSLERVVDRRGRTGAWLRTTAPDKVLAWAWGNQLKRVWVAHPPVGPTREPLSRMAKILETNDIQVRWYAREWDHRLHPHASAGFFRFRKHGFAELGRMFNA